MGTGIGALVRVRDCRFFTELEWWHEIAFPCIELAFRYGRFMFLAGEHADSKSTYVDTPVDGTDILEIRYDVHSNGDGVVWIYNNGGMATPCGISCSPPDSGCTNWRNYFAYYTRMRVINAAATPPYMIFDLRNLFSSPVLIDALGQRAIIHVDLGGGITRTIKSKPAVEIESVIYDETDGKFRVYGKPYPWLGSLLLLIDTIDPFT